MTNRFQLLTVCIMAAASLSSCKKEEGKGGNSSIIGHVSMREYFDASFTFLQSEHAAFGRKVYIIYGDNTGVGDNTDTGPDGNYEFRFLRKGTYKLFVLSEDSAHATPAYVPDTIFTQVVEIKDKKETVQATPFLIYKVLH
jgi:hypothetical protein